MPNDNILLITTGRQRFDTLQALGNSILYTPHLNHLAQQGVVFTRCYVDCPIGLPARTTLMSGLAGYESGVTSAENPRHLLQDIAAARATLPAVLTGSGYQSHALGWQGFQPPRAHYGFEGLESEQDFPGVAGGGHGLDENSMAPVPLPASQPSPISWLAGRCAHFLQTRDPLRPFFLWAAFSAPSPPLSPAQEYWMLYQTGEMPPPLLGNWSRTPADVPPGFAGGAHAALQLFAPRQVQAVKRAYYALVTQVDYSLGLLFASLKQQALLESTWLIFASDSGEMLGDHHLAGSGLFFEGAAHVPLIIVPPAGRQVARGSRVDTLVQLADLYPTILDMAGLHLPESAEHTGTSLLQQPGDRIFYGNAENTHFCVVCDRIKLIYTAAAGGGALLFNLEDDPMEQVNLAQDEAWAPVYQDLWQMLIANVQRTSPEILDENGNFL